MKERLQKIMARAGYGSRRRCETLIRAGLVRVNGRVAGLGDKADPLVDRVDVDGRPIEFEPPVYIILNKPGDVITSLEDELDEGRTTVRDLVDVPGHIYPVGRLDKESEGLILMTNDGQLAHRLTHPSFEHEKRYHVLIEGHPGQQTLAQWRRGVMLDERMTAPAGVDVLRKEGANTWLSVVLREGRKRQIRRVAAQLGHPVHRLTRKAIGPLELGDLPPGAWRHLTTKEIQDLLAAADLRPDGAASRERGE